MKATFETKRVTKPLMFTEPEKNLFKKVRGEAKIKLDRSFKDFVGKKANECGVSVESMSFKGKSYQVNVNGAPEDVGKFEKYVDAFANKRKYVLLPVAETLVFTDAFEGPKTSK